MEKKLQINNKNNDFIKNLKFGLHYSNLCDKIKGSDIWRGSEEAKRGRL